MIEGLIAWSLRHRFLVLGATLLLVAAGARALRQTPVDALPDLGENQVVVYADWSGRGPREVEAQITHPLALSLQGLAGVREVRAGSLFGLALLTVIFDEGLNHDVTRQRVLERLNAQGDLLPTGVAARLGPDATGLGWVYQYYLAVDPAVVPLGGGSDLGALRALQDFLLRPELNAVPGVAEVAGIGGFVRQYQIVVDPRKMSAAGVSLEMLLQAVGQANLNVGGGTITENGMDFVVRGLGLARNADDLQGIALTVKAGTPICLRDVARVELGAQDRAGALDVAGRDVVGGTVVLRSGEDARAALNRIRAKVAQLGPRLPPGVSICAFYDRGELIDRTVGTLRRALVEEILLVTLAHILFLWHFRSILIVTLPLPASLLISFLLLRPLGVTANIMSLSGLAIAIGVLVDAAIVLTENVLRQAGLATRIKGGPLTSGETLAVVQAAARQLGRPIAFALAIIIFAFLPVFALSGPEGRLFHPLALAKTLAMAAATLLALTTVPVLCSLLVRGHLPAEDRNWVMRALLRCYDPVLAFALRRPRVILGGAAVVLAGALGLAPRLGSEFMPPLNEGALLFMPSYTPATGFAEVRRALAWQDRVLAGFPEVASAVGKMGRADTATDPAPVEMIETTITLKPAGQWRPGLTRDQLVAEMVQALRQVPGSVPGFLQPIEGRILMLDTGIRAQLGVKLLGDDAAQLERAALDLQRLVQDVPGATGVAPSRTLGKPYVEIELNRAALTHHGLRPQQVLDVVETGLGGRIVTTIQDGRERFPVQVRLQREDREDLSKLDQLLVNTPTGLTLPLGQLATVRRVSGPNEIASENGRLRAFVQANVAGRDLAGFVRAVQTRVERELAPGWAAGGITVEYSGEYENQLHAAATLRLIVPAAVLIIFGLLRWLYGRTTEAAHVLLAVPFALSGGVFLQAALGWHFSVAVWVGYLALFGTAIQTGVVMVVYLEEAVARRRRELGAAFAPADLLAAVSEGARLRLRPKVMTVATIVASLLPIFWSHGPGAGVLQPFATPVLGGMLSSLVHILIVTPVIFTWLKRRELFPSRP